MNPWATNDPFLEETPMHLLNAGKGQTVTARPLDMLKVLASGHVSVTDGEGKEYFAGQADGGTDFTVGGALGVHTVRVTDAGGRPAGERPFRVEAQSGIDDGGGVFRKLFDVLERTMNIYGGTGTTRFRGQEYKHFVPWILDHVHTAKGFKYLSPHADGLVNLLKSLQKQNGMIWSFVSPEADYHLSAYGPYGYAETFDGCVAVRQPVENHCEYNYVDCVHLAWQSGGDDAWMRGMLDSCKKALDYGMADRARWSERHQLLKRGYTIDSWDFQPHDRYLVAFPLGRGQMIDPEKTKFTIFYGDNTGYAQACDDLAAMLAHAGRADESAHYAARAAGIRERLDALAWNGEFYRHRIEEDPSVTRDFGVDESRQISFSNCYTLNRGCARGQAEAILRSYQKIWANRPDGSPGEFYAIYPPFERGFDEAGSNGKWQYMNGGVHPHAAGELARGAFRFGFAKYGADILRRVLAMAEKSGGVLKFAYTGAETPAPPAQVFTPVDISAQANMDTWNDGKAAKNGVTGWLSEDRDNDLRHMPTGGQIFAGVPYTVIDPARNGRKAAVAVSQRSGLPQNVDIPVNAAAGSLYLLHATSGCPESRLVSFVTFLYADGTERMKPLLHGKHVTNWWFASLDADGAGIAWKGKTEKCFGMGVCWAEMANPHPERQIKAVRFTAGPDGALYALLGLTLSDRPSHKKPPFESTGGPDNWSGGLCMAALMEGLGGVTDKKTVYSHAEIAPRWTAAGVDGVRLTARYAASKGYVAYRYAHDAKNRTIGLAATGSGSHGDFKILLPEGATGVRHVTVNGVAFAHTVEKNGESLYCAFTADPSKPLDIQIVYAAGPGA